MKIAIVGGGVFGTTAALSLAERGHAVVLHEAGTVPRPEAASTDVSKLVRMDYGSDRFYRDLGAAAIAGWERWPYYHPDGFLALASAWTPGGFERDSFDALSEIGAPLERFDRVPLAAWRWDGPGYVNRRGGWAESGAVVAWLAGRAVAAGAALRERSRPPLAELDADRVIVAAGAWSPDLVPALRPLVKVVGQPIWHLRPDDPARWKPPAFLPFACDIGNTGWYGFPANADGVVKIANHGPGLPLPPDGPREVDPSEDARLRAFLRAHLPGLADAPIVARRRCLYTDVFDGDFVIDHPPGDDRVLVATGGSGHAFKFAPVLGDLVADAIEGRSSPRLARFRWRPPGRRRAEQARHDA